MRVPPGGMQGNGRKKALTPGPKSKAQRAVDRIKPTGMRKLAPMPKLEAPKSTLIQDEAAYRARRKRQGDPHLAPEPGPTLRALTPGGSMPPFEGGRSEEGAPPESRTGPHTSRTSLLEEQEKLDKAALEEVLRPPLRVEMAKAAEDREALRSIVTKCRAHTSAAVDSLVRIMNKSTHAPSVVAAAKALIEFGHGKAPMQINVSRVYSPDQLRELAEAIILKRAQAELPGGSIVDAQLESRDEE